MPALLRKVLTHSDPWFAALASAHLSRRPDGPGNDPQLAARLLARAAEGEYVGPRVHSEDRTAPGPHGPVALRVYQPQSGATTRPLLVWVHGGAFLAGDLDMHEADATAREVCARAGAVVV